MRIVERPSPNHDARQRVLDMLVLHYTGMETGEAALARLCDPAAKVSAHYLVREDGVIVAMVPEDRRAWHAGVSRWQGDDDLNSRAIGVEIVNGGHDFPDTQGRLPAYPDIQIRAVMSLCEAILQRWPIPSTRIVGHSDIAPTRKRDPGEHFPWQRLAGRGIGLWPHVQATPLEGDYGPALSAIGYDTSDLPAALNAFQRRFVPHRLDQGPCAETRSWLAAVAALYESVPD